MTVLKSEINTNDFFLPKKFSRQSLKKRFLLIANFLINLFRKLNKDQKPENSKRTFYVNIKILFGLHVPFAINFMFELKMSFKKIFDITPGLI